MKAFYYRILTPEGIVQRGIVRLAVERDFSARLWLERRYGAEAVLTLRRLPDPLAEAWGLLKRLLRRGIRPEHAAGFLRDLAVMSGAGVPMLDALRSMGEERGEQPEVAEIANRLLDDLDGGASITETFARHPDIFPETVQNLVAIGDQSGQFDRMLLEAAQHMDRLAKIKRDVRTALIYPGIVFAAIIGVAIFWVYHVIPSMAQLFRQLHAKLPPLTQGLVAFADFLSAHLAMFLLAVVAAAVLARVAWARSPRLRVAAFRLGHRLPIARLLLRSSGMAYMTEHLAILMRAGLDIVRSLDVLERATRDQYYRSRIAAMRERVAGGDGISAAMRWVGGFPTMAVRMIAAGERSGSLDKQLSHLANEYRQRLDALVASLEEVVKPAVIVVAGGLFLLLVVALLLPIYDLVRQAVTAPMMGG